MLYGKMLQQKKSRHHIIGLIALLILIILTHSCAQITKTTSFHTQFYVIPETTYLRESPRYEEKVLTELHRGDQIIVLEDGDSSWWRVQQVPDGQIGWVQKALLTSTAIPSSYYYVNLDRLPLLSSPSNNSQTIQSLSRGERVSRLEDNSQGWWHVQLVDSGIKGWVPASGLAEQLVDVQAKQVSKNYYYVAVKRLGLRAKPWIQDEIIRNLKFNEQVEKISQNSLGWFKVRLPANGALGWVISRYLEPLPLAAPRPEVQTRVKPKTSKPRKELMTEPEIM